MSKIKTEVQWAVDTRTLIMTATGTDHITITMTGQQSITVPWHAIAGLVESHTRRMFHAAELED